MERCNICGRANGHSDGCPNGGNEIKNQGSEIRCSFCGTMNRAGTYKCRSCNAVLDGSIVKKQYRTDNGMIEHASEIRVPTARESANENENSCPACGYMLRSDAKKCPNCQNNIVQHTPQGNNVHNHHTPMNRNLSEPIWNDTHHPEFKIGLCDKDGNISNAKTYAADDVVLGREELAPTDNHISRKHIHLTNKDGQWYIEDVSSTHQTYIIVKEKTRIENGDVIVLGNKFYRFVTE